jgi:hypothetical protein
VPEHKAKAYEESLRTGSTIISIHTETADALRKARNVLSNAEAAEILEVVSDANIARETSVWLSLKIATEQAFNPLS